MSEEVKWIAKQIHPNYAEFGVYKCTASGLKRLDVAGGFAEKDARLIASAPMLLESLKWSEEMLTLLKDHLPNPDTYNSYMAEVRKARAVIAMAQGHVYIDGDQMKREYYQNGQYSGD